MKKLILFLLFVPAAAFGQTGAALIQYFSGTPGGSCSIGRTLGMNISNGDLYFCKSGTWTYVLSGGGTPGTAPGDTIYGNNTVSPGTPSFFQASGDLSFGGGSFSVNRLHFGPTALTLSNTGIATGNCLTISGSDLIGGACGTGGGGGLGTVTSFGSGNLSPLFTTSVTNATTTPSLSFALSLAPAGTMLGNNGGSSGVPSWISIPTAGLLGCTTPTNGNFVCTNSITGGTGPVGMLTLPYAAAGLPTPPTSALAAIAANSAGQLFWSPGNSTAFTAIGGTGGGGTGTVTTFSAGTLSPLFTTSVANASTTPSLSFTLSQAPAGTMLGNSGASAAAPAWISIPTGGGAAGTATALQFGSTVIPLGTSALTAGQHLAFNGTTIVGANTPLGGVTIIP